MLHLNVRSWGKYRGTAKPRARTGERKRHVQHILIPVCIGVSDDNACSHNTESAWHVYHVNVQLVVELYVYVVREHGWIPLISWHPAWERGRYRSEVSQTQT